VALRLRSHASNASALRAALDTENECSHLDEDPTTTDSRHTMTTSNLNSLTPSEFDDEVDDAALSSGQIWAYPCKLLSCPDYGKSWRLRSNFLAHLQDQEAHAPTATTPAARRSIELEWRYATDPHLPPRAAPDFRPQEDPEEQVWDYGYRDDTGKLITGKGTLKEMEILQAALRRQAEEKEGNDNEHNDGKNGHRKA
jgi:hypothetical protein